MKNKDKRFLNILITDRFQWAINNNNKNNYKELRITVTNVRFEMCIYIYILE